ncbi:NAD(P)/FAD-dependent oxidoreductase [Haloarcula sp. Atlit-7R]|nr:NAD(P)/FAD-dependent oxidoreductase [Haloarcula sp. Atlit-7R]
MRYSSNDYENDDCSLERGQRGDSSTGRLRLCLCHVTADTRNQHISVVGTRQQTMPALDRLVGGDGLEAIRTKAGGRIAVDGLFVALGTAGGTDIAEALGSPVEGGELETAPDQSTAADRVYAASDVTGGQQQISTSVGEGARAAMDLLEDFRGADYVDYKKIGDATALTAEF